MVLTSGQQGLGDPGRLHGLPLPPDGDHDDGVAAGDDDGGDEEEGDADQRHPEPPVPGLGEGDPALEAVLGIVLRNCQVIQEDDGDGEGDGEDPCTCHQPLCSSP